jgi:riboflavin synthase
MFTGIVQGLCPIVALADEPGLRRIAVALGSLAEGLAAGASVAINGCCLTVTRVENGVARFDVIRESLGRTNLDDLAVGRRVNVERSLRFGDEIGGHVLSGHVSDVARVVDVVTAANERRVVFSVASHWMSYLHYKGFVALDGASLTIAGTDPARQEISVSLIPETIGRTTLGTVTVGDRVNLEIDAQTQAIVETVERVLSDPEWRRRLTGVESVAGDRTTV